jgi:hypothetical protein
VLDESRSSEPRAAAQHPADDRPTRSPTIEPLVALPPAWGASRCFGFRFLFSYILLYTLPFPLGWLPWTEKAGDLYQKLVDPVVVWFGSTVLGVDGPIATAATGSTDRTYDYVALVLHLSLAIAAALVWSLLDRRRHHTRLLDWLRLYVRVIVGITMIAYGVAKFFETQFTPPSAAQLQQSYADSSPMNLLWTFMGYSRPYRVFAGLIEVVPGLMLLWRRTAGAGALVLLGVMGNVVVLNFCYDVPVKLYSSHLWLMSLFVAWPSLRRLVDALILNRPVASEPAPRLLASPRARRIGAALYVLLVALCVFEVIRLRLDMSAVEKDIPIRGTFAVEEMTVDGRVLSAGDSERWRRLWLRRRGLWIYWADGRSAPYRATAEISGPMTLDLSGWRDETRTRRALLDIRLTGNELVVDGDFEGRKVRARLTKMEASQSLLFSRGFHWISETPHNR